MREIEIVQMYELIDKRKTDEINYLIRRNYKMEVEMSVSVIKSPPSIALHLQLPAESPSFLDDTIRSRNHPTAKANSLSPPSLRGRTSQHNFLWSFHTPRRTRHVLLAAPYRFLPPPPSRDRWRSTSPGVIDGV
ncbi:hypothetical protein CEXT_115211 [Caerostris extrusa]|uniref:Uncharacterized protein n=1 Tax=Caerostris extrusa TaxID=172846 RepID=A0AAV4Y500_CAEEX|nr:hypothetical protein CEXT_115211 [Caerostris extrusa]